MGGCGKPGHVTAGSDEGTQWCATCVSDGEALAPYHVRDEANLYSGDYWLATFRNGFDARLIADALNSTVALRGQVIALAKENSALKAQKAPHEAGHGAVERLDSDYKRGKMNPKGFLQLTQANGQILYVGHNYAVAPSNDGNSTLHIFGGHFTINAKATDVIGQLQDFFTEEVGAMRKTA